MVFVGGVAVGGHPIQTRINDLPSGVRDVLQGDSQDPVTAEVLDLLESGYYVDVTPEKLQRASVDGLVKSLNDPYTYYLNRDQYAEQQRQTNSLYFGVGMRVTQRGKTVVVTGLFPKSPASEADVQAGDVIISVDGKPAGGVLDTVVASIRGPENTTVRVGLRRGTRRLPEITLTRRSINVPVVSSRVITRGDQRVGYARLDQFTRGSAKALRVAVDGLVAKKVTSLVFDLRSDPGGLVDEAVGVAGVFLPKGAPVVSIEGRTRAREDLKTRSAPASADLPLVVLVDRNSASSSEIVTGALRDDDRAKIVGTRTFGKALVQNTVELRDGGALHYTTARYRTPDGIDINKRGLQPDVRASDVRSTRRDEALDRAVAVASAQG